MTFAKIISEAGLKPTDYPNASEISVTVVDQEGRNLEEEELNFASPIFSEKSKLEYFEKFLRECETTSTPRSLNIIILEHALIIRNSDIMEFKSFDR